MLLLFRDPIISEISQWYIDLWSSQIVEGNMHAHVTLQSCQRLKCVLQEVDRFDTRRQDRLHALCERVHDCFAKKIYFDALLLDGQVDRLPYNGVDVQISSTISIFNELAQWHNVSGLQLLSLFISHF